MIWPHVRGQNWDLVIGDAWNIDHIFKPGSFDACYMDIWSEICTDNKEQYVAMKKLARKIGSRRTIGWVEDQIYERVAYF